ncbi:alpha/beta fold hydrolase [Vibrio maerlii]|uniref:alpha/beta fold hydrolase n=1 Tax=Vibrio maerlii TaxID=2231648 RepID=UPI000E3C4B67|nr:alpha/beta fold hydrolase [Vibrio maerlii]
MSEKIYFNTSGKFSLKRSLVNMSTRLHHTVAPKHARNTARKLLLTPVRTPAKNDEPKGLIKAKVQSTEGELSTYSLGEGPTWVLTHGWSGTASQFFPLMEHIAAKGFRALAYDHPAHGQSQGTQGHIPAFIAGLEAILDTADEVAGIIGHSMGTASTLECRHAKAENCPLLLIAPVLNYVENLFGSVARSGYSMKLFSEVVNEIEVKYNFPIQSIDPLKRLSQREHQTIIVHDKDDKFTRFDVSKDASESIERAALVATTGQGHGRVMKCQEVMDSFDKLITANR